MIDDANSFSVRDHLGINFAEVEMLGSFFPGQSVVVVLRDPRERIWGRLLGLDPAGIAVHGLDLSAWEETLSLVRRGEGDQVALSSRFLPMHRVETMYLDRPSCGAPSHAQEFRDRSGVDPVAFLADDEGEEHS